MKPLLCLFVSLVFSTMTMAKSTTDFLSQSPKFNKNNFMVISDFDDTAMRYMHTESGSYGSPVDLVLDTFIRAPAYAGMPALYHAWSDENGDNNRSFFQFLTARPWFISITSDLYQKYNDLVSVPIQYSSSPMNNNENYDYKSNNINQMVNNQGVGSIIFLGDNVSVDHQVYHGYALRHKEKATISYIRPVDNSRRAEADSISRLFYTAYEVAFQEANEGRLSKDSALKIGQKVLDSPIDVVMPSFMHCPEPSFFENIIDQYDFSQIVQSLDLIVMMFKVEKRVRSNC